MKNDLSNRYSIANSYESKSKWEIFKSGVPQSTILGPRFTIYINDLCHINTQAQISLFADDTTLFIAGHNCHLY